MSALGRNQTFPQWQEWVESRHKRCIIVRMLTLLALLATVPPTRQATRPVTAVMNPNPQALNAAKPKLANPATPPQLLNRADVAASMDYPEDALRKEEQGTAQVWLLVGTDGQVERCGLESSSGSDSLGIQTCNVFLARGRFSPALDRGRRKVQSVVLEQLTFLETRPHRPWKQHRKSSHAGCGPPGCSAELQGRGVREQPMDPRSAERMRSVHGQLGPCFDGCEAAIESRGCTGGG
jgi:protein TonB